MSKALHKQRVSLSTLLIGVALLLSLSIIPAIIINSRTPLIFNTPSTSAPAVTPAVVPPTASDWLTAVNAERVKAGVPTLSIDHRLNDSAQKKANELQAEGLDDSPHVNNAGVQGYSYGHEAIPACTYVSENIIWSYYTIPNAINWWLHSDSHRAAMLDSRYTLTGFGTSSDGKFTVEHFCQV